jgi:UV DNA damage endonuclease
LSNVRYGYACLNMTLGKQGGFRSMIKRTWLEKGLPHASKLSLENVKILRGIVEWNSKNGFEVYRMTSDLFPWASEYEMESLPDWREINDVLVDVGNIAKRTNQRLTFHPGQFNCLTSPHEHVVLNCVKDLTIHGKIMDYIGLSRSPDALINIHAGGAHGDRVSAAERFCKNFELLPDSVKTRLTVENDDKESLFSTRDLYEMIHTRVGIPIVHDFHHAKFRKSADMNEEEELRLAASTWKNGIRQLTHYSESASLREGKDVIPQAHSEYVDGPVSNYGLTFDCDIEAKAKELAVISLRNKEMQNKSAA